MDIAEKTFRKMSKQVVFTPLASDGDFVKKGKTLATITGPARAILTGERVALNFMQRLSGIATHTRAFTKMVAGLDVRLLDTRKTTPCLRILERYAVMVGGGVNHRFGLFDAILIKDNHIMIAGSVTEAIKRVRKNCAKDVRIEVEVSNQRELREALKAKADIIMLDNMDAPKIKKAVAIVKGRAITEASGGVNLKNIRAIAKTGVDCISIGSLTHSARAMDISLRFDCEPAGTSKIKKGTAR
jgi:nicotinate-nucleotide pyrophosphorylase (carboxylating)